MSGAGPRSSPNFKDASSVLSCKNLKISMFFDLAEALSNGMFFFIRYPCQPNVPRPTDLSFFAELTALHNVFGAVSIKCWRLLSNKRIISSINFSLFFHESYFSKLTEDKQQTAVRSGEVGNSISIHKLEPW